MANIELTQELVKSLFDYKDGILYWKVSPIAKVKIGDKAGHLHKFKKEYRNVIKLFAKQYLRSRIIFLWHKGYLPQIVDHQDRNSSNDKIENLRDATYSQNNKNRKASGNSKYLGVSPLLTIKKHKNKKGIIKEYKSLFFRSRINVDGKNKYLGIFKTEKKAAIAYNEAAKIYHGEFANLNVIEL